MKHNIYDYLKGLIGKEDIYTFFMLSDNYYASPACLNEMGAVWVMQKEYITFLLPGFQYNKIEGAINPREIAIYLGDEKRRLQSKLNELKEDLEGKFNLKVNLTRWEYCRDQFIDRISQIYTGHAANKDDIIDLRNSRELCIGENLASGCVCNEQDITKDYAEINFDFSATKSDLCSFVVYIDDADWSIDAEKNAELKVKLTGSSGMSKIRIEVHLGARVILRYVNITERLEEYCFRLRELCENMVLWKCVKEVCFLVEKGEVPEKSTLIVQNLRLSGHV